MRNSTLLFVILVGFLTTSLIAQEKTWYDANWQETTEDLAVYYRPEPKKIKDGYWIVDYYKSGQVQMEGFSSVNAAAEGKEKFNGLVTYFHSNGKVSHKANYKNGNLHGVRKVFYETGELKEQGKYKNGKREGVWKIFYRNGKIKEKGKYKNGEKAGVWKTFYKNTY
ncbi:MORN repeat variant [Tenacibaculum sp. 190524A02b]|uniref:MORN repeat variant n=1 Tax=Tenacibaculum vairaonense TaxID=3137860 RepID=A0ABP1FDL2_9FLAO